MTLMLLLVYCCPIATTTNTTNKVSAQKNFKLELN